MCLNLACSTSVLAASVKSKYHSLKAAYSKIKVQEQRTGNEVEEPIAYPQYWDTMVYVDGQNLENSGLELSDVEMPIAKRQLVDKNKLKRNECQSNNSTLANGLTTLGETLAEGLVKAAQATQAPTAATKNKLLEALADTKRVQDALLEKLLRVTLFKCKS
ncbi:hypothetical protein AeNC1_015907 [Aphanomyces euteiches]|nr:hypothetical protein AeNC1_015907 [Aphanomyces euteiches]